MGNNDKPLGMSGGVPAGEIAKERADWLLDAVAAATQDRRYLRGDPEYNECAGEAILLNGEKAILVAIDRATPTPPIEGRDADVERVLRVAKAIARANGDEFANAFANKTRWIAKRGMSGGRFRDANEPFQSDYLAMARAALQALGGTPMTDDLVGRIKASVTYEYMPMKVRRQLSEAAARIEAPAGDGVEAVERVFSETVLDQAIRLSISSGGIDGRHYGEWADKVRKAAMIEALARPRAAVGEREA